MSFFSPSDSGVFECLCLITCYTSPLFFFFRWISPTSSCGRSFTSSASLCTTSTSSRDSSKTSASSGRQRTSLIRRWEQFQSLCRCVQCTDYCTFAATDLRNKGFSRFSVLGNVSSSCNIPLQLSYHQAQYCSSLPALLQLHSSMFFCCSIHLSEQKSLTVASGSWASLPMDRATWTSSDSSSARSVSKNHLNVVDLFLAYRCRQTW